MPYIQIDDSFYWVDDSNSKYYNKLIKLVKKEENKNLQYIEVEKNKKDWQTAEHLIQYKKQYKYAIQINYNENCEKKKGSAIFMHCSIYKPTCGCIAIPTHDIEYILKNIKKDTYIYIY